MSVNDYTTAGRLSIAIIVVIQKKLNALLVSFVTMYVNAIKM